MTNAQGNRGWAAVMVAATLMMLAATITAPAQTLETLTTFDGPNGYAPVGSLVQGRDGNLWGATSTGGASDAGTAFRLTPAGNLTTVYNFDFNSPDIFDPTMGLVLGVDGNFYGATDAGGFFFGGAIFGLTPGGVETPLFNFGNVTTQCEGLTFAPDGDFYGTTYFGGRGFGTIFKVSPKGALTPLHNFNFFDGENPLARVVAGATGDFYGTALGGSNSGCPQGCGVVFAINWAGVFTVLHQFSTGSDGNTPNGLVEGPDGDLYGTTNFGGGNGNADGTIFKVSPAGVFTLLHTFDGSDGSGPSAALILGTDGNFYGTTLAGGAYDQGTIFRMTPTGALTTLHDFNGSDGSGPTSLLENTNGLLYGYTFFNGGTVFSLDVGLQTFVQSVPGFGRVGSLVGILGNHLTGSSTVTFNGVPGTFTVSSDTFISATVPAGATTGPVQVVTPSGTLISNVSFQVLP